MKSQKRNLFALPPGKSMPLEKLHISTQRLPKSSIQHLDNAISQVVPGYKDMARDYVIDRVGQSVNNYLNTNNGIGSKAPRPRGNNEPTRAPSSAGEVVFTDSKPNPVGNGTYALSKAPNPKRIRLNSGIRPNTFAADSMPPIENDCSPLHVSVVTLQIPASIANNPLASYFQTATCFDIQTRAQARVAYSLNIATQLSATQLTTAFNAAIAALQCYFYFSSVLSFESNTKNKNSGMTALRANIDAQTLSDLGQLGRRLEDTPIPPRIVQWVRYMSGNFLSADTQGAPMLKLAPNYGVLSSTLQTTSLPAVALAALNSDANTTVFTLLRSCIPQWRVNTLYDLPTTAVFDQNFLSIFANIPVRNRPAASNNVYPTTTSNDVNISYNSYTNNLDAVAFAMSSVYNATTLEFTPGLVLPSGTNATNIDSRLSYYTVAGVKGFYSVVNIPYLGLCRPETYISLGATNYVPHLSGTDKCKNVSGTALLQSAQNTIDYLFNVEALPVKGNLNSFNKKANGKI